METAVALACALVLAAGCETAIDPGDVRIAELATSTAQEGWAVNYPKQRKLFVALGRLWIFFADGRDMRVRTTTDGQSFTDSELVRQDMVFGHRCAFAFDGTRFHSACSQALPGTDVFYRRGLPRDDGTIAWETEQVAFDVPSAQSVLYPKVLIDSSGHPWVAFMLFMGGFETAPQSAMVTRIPSPISGSGEKYGLYSAVTQGDELDVAYGGGIVNHRHRDAAGNWGPETCLSRQGSGHTTIAALGGGKGAWSGSTRTRNAWSRASSDPTVASRPSCCSTPGRRAGSRGGCRST